MQVNFQPGYASISKRQQAPRFGTQTVESFKPYYAPYAEAMVEHAVKGISPGELCVINLRHQDVSEKMLELYGKLLKKGYVVGINLIPEKTYQIFRSPQAEQKFTMLDEELNQSYTSTAVVRDDAGADNALAGYLARKARPGETLKLTVLTNDPDPLADEIAKRIVQKGGVPYLLGGNSALDTVLYKHARTEAQLQFISPEKKLYERMQKLFQVHNDPVESAPKLTPQQKQRKQAAQAVKSYVQNTYMARMRRPDMQPEPGDGFFRTLALSPTRQHAQECGFGNNVEAFGLAYAKMTKLDQPDVVEYYRQEEARIAKIARQLRKFHTLHIYTDNGRTDIYMSIRDKGAKESRYVAPSVFTGNAFPAEVFTSPVEDSVKGKIYLDIPFEIDNHRFQGLTLRFSRGRIVDVDVEQGDKELLRRMILDKKSLDYVKGLDRLGEVAIGLNPQISEVIPPEVLIANTLIGEKQDFHIAMGNGYAVTGGKNKSAIHKDVLARSGPGSGFHIEGLHDGAQQMMSIYDEGQFSEAFLNLS